MNQVRMQELLAAAGKTPNRALGQNFLCDEAAAALLADAAASGGAETALEVGPGLGALTEALLARFARVIAVEKDAALAALLPKTLCAAKLSVVTGDFLLTDAAALTGGVPFAAVGNLPYYVTTPITERLLSFHPLSLTLTVQREAAARFFARPGERVYGPLAVTTQVYYTPRRLCELPAARFWPQPEVDSAAVQLSARADAPGTFPPAALLAFCRRAFAMRRKTLKNNFAGVDVFFAACEQTGVDPSARAEALPPETLFALCETLHWTQQQSEGERLPK